MNRLNFDSANPDLEIVRTALLHRLRDTQGKNPPWQQMEDNRGKSFETYIEFNPVRHDSGEVFSLCLVDVFWQFVNEGVLAPGINLGSHNANFPWFHLTRYGRRVIATDEYQPHDRGGYLALLSTRIQHPDPTVLAYLNESLETFVLGNRIASMLMLGVAAERVFDLLCESLAEALTSDKERNALQGLMGRTNIKRRLEFVTRKFASIKPDQSFPEGALSMLTTMYELTRIQRNELGHPRSDPPRLDQVQVNSWLHLFAGFYEIAELVDRTD